MYNGCIQVFEYKGTRYTFAPLIEDLLKNHLKLSYSSTDGRGIPHPASKLNNLAQTMFSKNYRATLCLHPTDWCVLHMSDKQNREFLQDCVNGNILLKKNIQNNKVHVYSMRFVTALIHYCFPEVASEVICGLRTNPFITSLVKSRNLILETSIAKTHACQLFDIAKIQGSIDVSTVISTFSAAEQTVIREYMTRCKNTFDNRKRKGSVRNGKA